MSAKFNIAQEDDGSKSLSAYINGQWYNADQSHPNFEEIERVAIDSFLHNIEANEQELVSLFDASLRVGQVFERVSRRVAVSSGRVYFDGEEIDTVLTQEIIRRKDSGDAELHALVNFFEKIANNPSQDSREHLYRWITTNNLTITSSGNFIAYKGLRAEYLSGNSGTAIVDGVVVKGRIPNAPGSVVSMPRRDVTFDPSNGCASGLHVATFSFAQDFRSNDGYLVSVSVDPGDVVSVPNGEDKKMRVCQYIVLETVEGPYPEPLYDDSEDEDDDYYAINWIGDDDEDTTLGIDDIEEEDDEPVVTRGWRSWFGQA